MMIGLEKNIKVKSYSFSDQGPHLLITAGVHGDEWEPILAVQRLKKILENTSLAISGQISLVSITNEPAYNLGERTAEDGKDLARTCPGNLDGSITEKIAREISGLIQKADFYIDMHTGGNEFEIYPLAGYMLHSDPDVLNHQRSMARAFNMPIVWGTSPDLDGRTLSVARDANIPAIYTEFGGGGESLPKIIDSLIEGCFGVMRYLEMAAWDEEIKQREQFWLEDFRKSSGHLQIMHPSSIDGIFSSQKKIGDKVGKGEVIGFVDDPLSGNNSEIIALEEGVLFLLRKYAKVNKGTATAGVLPISGPGKYQLYE